jgi:hypothetical protein
MCRARSFTLDEAHREFDHKLRRGIFFGIFHHENPTALDEETALAVGVVAEQFPNVRFGSVLSAREEFQRQLDGTHAAIRDEQIKAMWAKCGYKVQRF